MNHDLKMDSAGRIELTPEPDNGYDSGLLMLAGKRTVLRPTGKPFDAAAAVRSERDAQAIRATKRQS